METKQFISSNTFGPEWMVHQNGRSGSVACVGWILLLLLSKYFVWHLDCRPAAVLAFELCQRVLQNLSQFPVFNKPMALILINEYVLSFVCLKVAIGKRNQRRIEELHQIDMSA